MRQATRPWPSYRALTRRGRRRWVDQSHVLQECSPAWVIVKVAQENFSFHLDQTRIALRIGSLQPSERLVGIAKIGIGAGDLKCRAIGVRGAQRLQRGIRLGALAQRMI